VGADVVVRHFFSCGVFGFLEAFIFICARCLFFIIIILLSVCLVTEFFEQMKKTDHKEDIPRGYVLEDLEDHDKNIH